MSGMPTRQCEEGQRTGGGARDGNATFLSNVAERRHPVVPRNGVAVKKFVRMQGWSRMYPPLMSLPQRWVNCW